MSVGHSPNEGERCRISKSARLTIKSHVLLLEVEFGFVLPFDDRTTQLVHALERAMAYCQSTSTRSSVIA